jgi:hypothetical protein
MTLYSVLSRPELDARKSSYSESTNSLEFLEEIYNDYDNFQPQNLMAQYVSLSCNSHPMKKCPYVASFAEWSYLAEFTHELVPANLSRINIIQGLD